MGVLEPLFLYYGEFSRFDVLRQSNEHLASTRPCLLDQRDFTHSRMEQHNAEISQDAATVCSCFRDYVRGGGL